MSSSRRPASVRQGYALPMTLAAIIVIALVSAIAAQQLRTSTQSVTRLADHVRGEAAMISAEQTLIYLMLTEPMTVRGVDVGGQASVIPGDTGGAQSGRLVAANGAPYRLGDRDVVVRLLGQKSFLNISSSNPDALGDALSLFGVPDSEHAAMFAALQDYQDPDDLRRLSGAESGDYVDDGLPPNRPLRGTLEVCAVKGWRETALCADPGRLLLLGQVRDSDIVSPRLASRPLIGEMAGDTAAADEAFARYATGEWRTFDQVGAPGFDVVRDPLAASGAPGPGLTVITHHPDGSGARRTVVELTPGSVQSPFLIRSRYAIAGPYAQNALRIESLSDVTPLPEPPANAFRR